MPARVITYSAEDFEWSSEEDGYWTGTLYLTGLQNGAKIIPSLCLTGRNYSWQSCLMDAEADVLARTLPVGYNVKHYLSAFDDPEQGISQKLDYFQIDEDFYSEIILVISVHAPDHDPKTDLLRVTQKGRSNESLLSDDPGHAPLRKIPPLSQMDAPEAIKARSCSPTCIAMALSAFDIIYELNEVYGLCYHKEADLYGVWPQNIMAASQYGLSGSVRCFTSWDEISALLNDGHIIIASIAYKDGELTGASQAQTEGHLVLICGVDQKHVYVNDPAAPNASDVPRSYDLQEFTRAWAGHGGIGYELYKV